VCCPGFGDAFNVLDDRRAGDMSNPGQDEVLLTYVTTLLPEPAMKVQVSYYT
jgi:hypothetical protein